MQFVVATLTVWGVFVYGGYQLVGENKELAKVLVNTYHLYTKA
jgi:hypothetical protein